MNKLETLVSLWIESPASRAIAAEWARRSDCGTDRYFELLFKNILPHVQEKKSFFHEILLTSFLVRWDPKEIWIGLFEAVQWVKEEADLKLLAKKAWEFNEKYWKVDKQWIQDVIPDDNPLGFLIQTEFIKPKKSEESRTPTLAKEISEVAGALRAAVPKGRQIQKRMSMTDEELKEVRRRMFLLSYYRRKIKEFPLSRFRFLIVLHFLKDLIPFLESCERLGLRPSGTILFYKNYLYPHRELIQNTLEKRGYKVQPLAEIKEATSSFLRSCPRNERIVIVEDGGYLALLIHQEFSRQLTKIVGAVEQTTKGVNNDDLIPALAFDVHSVADADLKRRFEPPHVARAVVDNIRKLVPGVNFSGQTAGLLGYGTIGKHISSQLGQQGLKMIVSVFDPDPNKRLEACDVDGYNTCDRALDAVDRKTLVVGCSSGKEASVGRTEILAMESGTFIVSATSDQKEIGVLELENMSEKKESLVYEGQTAGTTYQIRGSDKRLHLLADGYPINFWASESMPDQVSDLIMTLILLALVDICEHGKDYAPGINRDVVNRIAHTYKVAELYMNRYHPKG